MIVIEIPKFAKEIQISKARRAKFYYQGEKIPKKYQTKFYTFLPYKGKMVLIDNSTKQPVIKNPNAAGKPSYTTIAGNDIWNTHRVGAYTEQIKLSLQNWFWQVIKYYKLDKVDVTELLPLHITFDFYTYKEKQDLDNLKLFYEKAFIDAIQDSDYANEARWLRNDSTKQIKALHTNHYDVVNREDEKLVITLQKSNNTVVDYEKEIMSIDINTLKK